jgi:transcriptional regulator with PAS, ATPase and Fis domain
MTVMSTSARSLSVAGRSGGPIYPFGIVGSSDAVLNVLRLVERIADTRSTVLITGETGTGKELVARAVHACSARRQMPFVAVNCAAIPEQLLESELFGHVKGAFTGSVGSRRGRFQRADRGTIFLDEIGTMRLEMQAKLLRVLQEREVEPLGADVTSAVDVRVIAATNRDLRELVASGRFREDLFYRLNVIRIATPALRDRREDIPELIDHFVATYARRSGKQIIGLEDDVVRLLQSHHWQGNVRELENTIERAVALSVGARISVSDLALESGVRTQTSGLPSLRLLENVEWAECETIRQALRVAADKRRAATLMGISPRALSYYLAKYRLADLATASADVAES